MSKKKAKAFELPERSKVKKADTWDLALLFATDAAWEKEFEAWEKKIVQYAKFKNKFGQNAKSIALCLQFDADFDRQGEKLGNYAFLRTTEDQGNSPAQRMKGRFQLVASNASEAASWIRPQLLAIDEKKMNGFLKRPELAPWKLALERILRYRPHTLSVSEEKLLASQAPVAMASKQTFTQLNDADLRWGMVKDDKGREMELGHSAFSLLLHNPSRKVRQEAFAKYYEQFDAHKNTIAATLNGSVQTDVCHARARNYPSALEASLFQDNVPVKVYDNLIDSVHRHLPSVHRYFEVRKRKMKLKDIHHYDTYVPILSDQDMKHTWDQAVDVTLSALRPLGDEYVSVLKEGLTQGRWADRYPNRGKRSGAFSSGGYDGPPYLQMNYQENVLDQVFTLAHEAGHSMHTWHSAKNQPYPYYGYTIFVAEVASTFNEQLLAHHLMQQARDKRQKAYLVNRLIDAIRGTIIRQTMFAEFEKVIHAQVESNEPLTVQSLRSEYRKLLDLYFGKNFVIESELELECLRIPHFYNAFYVYKYATGLSAAIALSQRVLKGGKPELNDYLGFLKGGCSKWPLDLLRGAGVDMEKPDAVNTALTLFGRLVEELDSLI